MKDTGTLANLTDQFKKMHLNPSLHKDLKWSDKWYRTGILPNHDQRGVYDFLNNDEEVIYIGVGVKAGSNGTYRKHGIGSRVFKRFRLKEKINNKFLPRDGWEEVESVITLAFTEEYSYMAYSLEQFLIQKMKPKLNKVGFQKV